MNKSLYYLLIFSVLLGLLSKFPFLDNSNKNFNTNDIQHVLTAFNNIKDGSSPFFDLINLERSSKVEHKYPLFSSRMYMILLNAVGFDDKDMIKNTNVISAFLTALFFLMILSILFCPIETDLKIISLVVLATSLIAHNYCGNLRIHMITGYFVFWTYIFSYKSVHSENLIWSVVALIFCAFAGSAFFTGWIAIIPLITGYYLKWGKERKYKQFWLWSTFSLITAATFFAYNHPLLISFIQGKSSLLDGNFDNYFEKGSYSSFGLSFNVYLNALWGGDPLFILGFIIGQIFIFKNKVALNSFWLLIWPMVIGYLLVMGILETNHIRRLMVIMPVAAFISAYGWLNAIQKNKINLIIFGLLILMNLTSSLKYTAIYMKQDTRTKCFDYIHDHANRSVTQVITNPYTHAFNNIYNAEKNNTIKISTTQGMGEKFILSINRPENLALKKRLSQLGISSAEDLEKSPIMPQLLADTGVKYYIHFKNYVPKSDEFDMTLARKDLIKEFSNSSSIHSENWPDMGSGILWRIWSIDEPGPQIELYRIN